MPFMETFSPGMRKQSPAPQHHSPAAFRNPPRLIQRSCADASEPIANDVPTKPTSAIDRGVIAVPPVSNAAFTPEFLARHADGLLAISSQQRRTAELPNRPGRFHRLRAYRAPLRKGVGWRE